MHLHGKILSTPVFSKTSHICLFIIKTQIQRTMHSHGKACLHLLENFPDKVHCAVHAHIWFLTVKSVVNRQSELIDLRKNIAVNLARATECSTCIFDNNVISRT